jgi:serine/threonine protein kinase
MIQFACPHCSKKFTVKDEFAGRASKCPACKRQLVVPQPDRTLAVFAPSCKTGDSSGSLENTAGKPDATLPTQPAPSQPGQEPGAEVPAGSAGPGGRYVLEREIARGGMGAVLRATDRDIRREVAVKFMLDDQDPRKKARFIEEAQITGQLEHPNIVPVHELGVDAQGRPFFSMKMVRGRSLAQVLDELAEGDPKAAQEWSQGRLLNILVGVCHALAYAHARSVIHRDLKPANIMVGDFGEVYVMDWRLAKVLGSEETRPEDPNPPPAAAPAPSGAPRQVVTARQGCGDATQDGAVMGTPAYMPPEQANGRVEALDQRSDIYSLGAILYALLTLQPPVEADGDYIGTLVRVVEGDIPPPEERAPERARRGQVPPELSAVAMKALAKEPLDRYQSVEAFRCDLERFLEGRSVSAKQDSAWEMFRKLVKRNKGASLATAAALVVLAVVGAVAFVINYRARVQAEANYAAFKQEQQDKVERMKRAAPAFVRAARLTASEKQQFDDALTQVGIALDWDPDLSDAYLLKGQLLIGLARYAEAVAPLQEYNRRSPDDPRARRLEELAGHPETDKAPYFQQLRQVFEEQKAFALADRMSRLADGLLGTLKERLPEYQKRLEANWGPATARKLRIDNGELVLYLAADQDRSVKDLAPLKEMPLARLNLGGLPIDDLEPLRDMPLVSLVVNGTKVSKLDPLHGLPLAYLEVGGTPVEDLKPLRGMPLKHLHLRGCQNLADLGPLRDVRLLTELNLLDCPKVEDLAPLHGLPLEFLHLGNCNRIKDLAPLRDMPLKKLYLGGQGDVTDFTPLKGLPLIDLGIGNCRWFKDMGVLEGMPLTSVTVAGCPVKSLAPLKGMELTWANLSSLKECTQFDALEGMPFTELSVANDPQLTDLKFLSGMKQLRSLYMGGCPGVKDLGPLDGLELRTIVLSAQYIDKGMEVLRDMKTLQTITVDGGVKYDSREAFWKDYKDGKFKR